MSEIAEWDFMLLKEHWWVIQTHVYDCSTGPRGEIETATCTEMTLTPPPPNTPSTVSQHAADLHHSAVETHAHIMEQSAARSAQNCFQNEIIDVLEVLAWN